MYAILKSAEFYGPRTIAEPLVDERCRLIQFHTRAEAAAAAREMAAADVAQYGCPVLGHNQASAWAYTVRRVPAGQATWRGAWLA